jgi:hypothetical protein
MKQGLRKQAPVKKGSCRLSKKRTTRTLTQGNGRRVQLTQELAAGPRLIIAPRRLEFAGS